MKLIYTKTGQEVKVGDVYYLRGGEKVVVEGWTKPQHAGSTGRVHVKDGGGIMPYYPGVINAEWIERDDQ